MEEHRHKFDSIMEKGEGAHQQGDWQAGSKTMVGQVKITICLNYGIV